MTSRQCSSVRDPQAWTSMLAISNNHTPRTRSRMFIAARSPRNLSMHRAFMAQKEVPLEWAKNVAVRIESQAWTSASSAIPPTRAVALSIPRQTTSFHRPTWVSSFLRRAQTAVCIRSRTSITTRLTWKIWIQIWKDHPRTMWICLKTATLGLDKANLWWRRTSIRRTTCLRRLL